MTGRTVRGARTVAGDPIDLTVTEGGFDADGLVALPGLVDLQVNGAAGIDLTLEPHRLWEVAAALPAYGVTAFLPTVITSSPSVLRARSRASSTARLGGMRKT